MIDWRYAVDAHTGAVLLKQNRIVDATDAGAAFPPFPVRSLAARAELDGTHSEPFVTGEGDVYPTHPDISSVTTVDLYRLSGNGYLQGTYVAVENDEDSEAYSGSEEFSYSTSNTHFDEVNLYYHVDDFRHNFIEGLGSLGFTQITAHAHSNTGYGPNNAWFLPSNQEIYFGDGTGAGFDPFSREDKVIYHEYGHAVMYDINSSLVTGASSEPGAISEGVPDYFAGAHTGRSLINEYAAYAYRRDMDDPLEIDSYAEYQSEAPVEAHDGGEFFSAILWDIRGDGGISGGQADFLVFDALDRVTSGPDTEASKQGPPSAEPVPAVFALKGTYPNPFNPTTTIRLDLPEAATVTVAVSDLLGRVVLEVPAQQFAAGANRSVEVDASPLASGVYLYRVVARTEARTHVATGRLTLVK